MTPVVETPLPPSERRAYVRNMFTAIAPRYDMLNHLLSLNVDKGWRRRAIDRLAWERVPNGTYLDACAGTLDLAAELARREGFGGRVVGADFVVPMLRLGRGKVPGLEPVGADTLQLPFPDASFAGVTVGFGVRNLVDLRSGFTELRRVLQPGAQAVILEFTTPRAWPIRPLYHFYYPRMLPLIGRIVSKHREASPSLPQSGLRFPEPDDLARLMEGAGFSDVEYERLTMGIVAVHWGVA
jgi:demethylmenaquinone methyltransferase/2-methoxy-6-polyprenyl-1,4-benzoquinol methylase